MDWVPGSHASTFGGNPVCIAAALATMDVLEREAIKNAEVVGNHIMERIADWVKTIDMVGDVRGRGLMIGIEIVKDKKTKEPRRTSSAIASWTWRSSAACCSWAAVRKLDPRCASAHRHARAGGHRHGRAGRVHRHRGERAFAVIPKRARDPYSSRKCLCNRAQILRASKAFSFTHRILCSRQ